MKKFLTILFILFLTTPSFAFLVVPPKQEDTKEPPAPAETKPADVKPVNTKPAEEKTKPIKRIDTMIAVFDLETKGEVKKDVSYPLTESIRREIVRSGKYEVIDRSNMDKVLGEQKLQLSGCVSGECIVEAGQLLGVGKIITGSVSLVGKTYYLSLSLINVETGKIEDQSEDKCKCEVDDLIDSSKRLVKKLMGEKVESPKETTDSPIKEQTPKSFSLEELEQNMKKDKAEWDKKTEEMKFAYNKVLEYEKKENISPEIKTNAWRHFLESFKEDNPQSKEDDKMRQMAKNQNEYWQKMAKRKGNPAERRDTITGMEFVYVDGGCYQRGGALEDKFHKHKGREEHWADAAATREFCLDGFYIGKYEVTQGQWKAIMGNNPSKFDECGDNCPVENVSWNDTQEFIKKLNQKTKNNPQAPFAKGDYRLPTESEWEYAASSGGRNEKYSGSDDVDSVAWYENNSGKETHPVGQKKPNGLGLYDMSGNVWEWVNDWLWDSDYYKNSPKDNPTGPDSGEYRVFRGDSYSCCAGRVTDFVVTYAEPDKEGSSIKMGNGFRLALPVK